MTETRGLLYLLTQEQKEVVEQDKQDRFKQLCSQAPWTVTLG